MAEVYTTHSQSYSQMFGTEANPALFAALGNNGVTMGNLAFNMATSRKDMGTDPRYGPRLLNIKKALDKGDEVALAREFQYLDRNPDRDQAKAIKQNLLTATRDNAKTLEQGELVEKLTAKFDKLGGSLDVVTKHVDSFSAVVQRATDTGKPLSQDEMLRQKAAYGLMEPLRQARDNYGSAVFDQALSAKGVAAPVVGKLNSTLDDYENVRLKELESLITGQGHGSAQGVRGMANKLFEGDLGQLGWGLFNVQRIWRMTGGQVQSQMGEYANYSAQQQQAIAALGGTQGYTGPVADVIGQTNAVKRFGLAMGKAGWDMFGWIPQAIGGAGFIDPDKPTGGMYLASGAMTLGGAALTASLANNMVGKLTGTSLVDAVAGSRVGMAAIGSGLADKVMGAAPLLGTVASAAGGAAIGTALAYDINRGGFLGTGLGKDAWSEDKDFGTWLKERSLNLGYQAFNLPRALAASALGDTQTLANIQAGESDLRQQWGMATEETEAQKQYRRYSDWGKNLEKSVNTLQAGEGLQVAKLIAKTSGISDGALTDSVQTRVLAEQIARQGLTEETANKVQFGMQLAHAAGYKYGDAGMAGYTAQNAMNLMPAQMMRAQSTFQNIGSFIGLTQQTGISLPWLNPQFLNNLDKGSQWTMAQIGGGNPLQVSRMAQLQLMNDEGFVGDAMLSGTVGDAAQKSGITNSIIGALEGLTGRNFRGEKLDDWRRAAKIASTDDIRSTITTESTGLPVMSTDESMRGRYFSRADYDKALAKTGFNLGGQWNQAPAFNQVESLASLENQQRDQQRGYQWQQFQFNAQSLQRSIDYTLGRPATSARYEGSQLVPGQEAIVGQFGWQRASLGESMRSTLAMGALQAGSLGGTNGYGWFQNALQGVPLGTGVTRGSVFIPQMDASQFTYDQASSLQDKSLGQLGQAGLAVSPVLRTNGESAHGYRLPA